MAIRRRNRLPGSAPGPGALFGGPPKSPLETRHHPKLSLHEARALFFRGAHSSGVLVAASRRNELFPRPPHAIRGPTITPHAKKPITFSSPPTHQLERNRHPANGFHNVWTQKSTLGDSNQGDMGDNYGWADNRIELSKRSCPSALFAEKTTYTFKSRRDDRQ